MATKRIGLIIAGQDTVHDMQVMEETTAGDLLDAAGLEAKYSLSLGAGLPAFGRDEKVFDRVKEGGKVYATPPITVGCSPRYDQ